MVKWFGTAEQGQKRNEKKRSGKRTFILFFNFFFGVKGIDR